MSGGSSLGVLYGYFTKGVPEKYDDLVGVVLLDALAGRFIWFGESDVHPRHFQAGRIGGPGRQSGNLPVTTAKPPVAQRAGGINTKLHFQTKLKTLLESFP